MTGTMRALDGTRGAVRVEDVYDTDIDDLWEACTTPERLARWIAEVSGDLHVGATVHAVFTSTWSGPARIDACEAPHHLLLTTDPGTEDESQMEAWLTTEESGTRLVVEERGLPVGRLHFHGAGWQVHLEDLGRSLRTDGPVHAGGWSAQVPAAAWHERWTALTPDYRAAGPPVSDRIRLDGITVNAPDALALAEFYAEITGGVARGTSQWAAAAGPNGFLAFQQVEDFRPPTWPGNSAPMQLHLDFHVDDLEATGARVRAAGATPLDFQPNSDHCIVYADPVGHPFCLSTWTGQGLFDRAPDHRAG